MTNQLAVQANINSMKYAMVGDKSSSLSLFSENAIVRDPVGKSPFDPEGNGHKGKAAIEAFWDAITGPATLQLSAIMRYPSGDHHCAVAVEAVNDLGGGIQTSIDMLAVYEVDSEGRIERLNAYLNWDELESQLKAHG